MAENSAIEWTDHTFNPWEGCQKVGPGCDHCYAETRNARFGGGVAGNWGPGAPRRLTGRANWQKPLRWQADAAAFLAKHGRRQRVFCASLADVFDNAVPAQWRSGLFDLIERTPDLDWLLLTKRISNVAKMTEVEWGTTDWPSNVWLGATIVNQFEADRDIPKLLSTRGPRLRFLSMEPLLGSVDLTMLHWEGITNINALTGAHGVAMPMRGQGDRIDWVIVGGESGTDARPMHPVWAQRLRDQCADAGVPFLFKQWGEWARAAAAPSGTAGCYAIATAELGSDYPTMVFQVDYYPRQFDLFGGASVMQRVGKKAAGRNLDGGTHDGVPSC